MSSSSNSIHKPDWDRPHSLSLHSRRPVYQKCTSLTEITHIRRHFIQDVQFIKSTHVWLRSPTFVVTSFKTSSLSKVRTSDWDRPHSSSLHSRRPVYQKCTSLTEIAHICRIASHHSKCPVHPTVHYIMSHYASIKSVPCDFRSFLYMLLLSSAIFCPVMLKMAHDSVRLTELAVGSNIPLAIRESVGRLGDSFHTVISSQLSSGRALSERASHGEKNTQFDFRRASNLQFLQVKHLSMIASAFLVVCTYVRLHRFSSAEVFRFLSLPFLFCFVFIRRLLL